MNVLKRFGGVRVRLLLYNLAFFCIFVGIIVVVHSSFLNVERSLTQIIDHGVNSVIQNASLGRELTSMFARSRRIVGDFAETPAMLRTESDVLLARLRQLSTGSMQQDAQFQEAMNIFMAQFQALIEQTVMLSEMYATLREHEAVLGETSHALEALAADSLGGLPPEVTVAPTILAQPPNPGRIPLEMARVRERLAQAQREFEVVRHTSAGFRGAPSASLEETRLGSLLTEFQERIASLNLDETGEMALYEAQLRQSAAQYATAIRQYLAAQHALHRTFDAMNHSQEAVLQRMQAFDNTMHQAANTLQDTIGARMADSEQMIVLLSVVFLGVVLTGWWVTMRTIRPLTALARCAEQLAGGDIEAPVVEIRSRDEIGRLSQAFTHLISYIRDMAHTATEISTGNLDLTVTPRSSHDVLGNSFQCMLDYLNDTGRFATLVAQGNLDGRITRHSERDQLGSTFIQMQTGLIDLIREIRLGADQIAAISQQVLEASSTNSNALTHIGNAAEVTSSAMRQVSSSVDEVRGNTARLSTSVETTSASISEMVTSITHVAENSRKLADFAEETRETMSRIVHSLETVATQAEQSKQLSEGTSLDARNGQAAVEQMIAKIMRIADVTQRISQTVKRLAERSTEIGTILDVINDVADQTSLLALNASIIAAQAGEHGRGFAVVAGEIKELATRVGTSTSKIAAIITSVQKESSQAAEELTHGQQEVESGVTVAREAGEALQKIADSARNSSDVAAEIATLVRQQTTASNRVAASIQDVADMVKEIRGATQEQEKNSTQLFEVVENMQELASQVARATDEQQQSTVHVTDFMQDVISLVDENMVAVKQLGQSANELAAQADTLKGQVQRFVLPA